MYGNTDNGFLIVKTYKRLYQEYAEKYDLFTDIYAFPRKDKTSSDAPIQYHGMDRDAIEPYTKSDDLAEIYLDDLRNAGKCEDGFIFSEEDVLISLSLLSEPMDYEVIWARIIQSSALAPSGFLSIGFEPTYFWGDHFSASCDCMVIPRWHGTDEEGKLFQDYFAKLNRYGLFDTAEDAAEFLRYYRSFDWTETGDYEIAEIFIQSTDLNQ